MKPIKDIFYSFYKIYTFVFNIILFDIVLIEKDYSKEFEELQETVQLIDAAYIQKWNSTAVNERKLFYKKNDETKIFRMFPNLASPAGYILVCIYCHVKIEFIVISFINVTSDFCQGTRRFPCVFWKA